MTRRPDRGVALLEALVALAILAAAGLSTIGMLRQAFDNERRMSELEHHADRADRVLATMSLLTAKDLDRRLGQHRVREFLVTVQRPEALLYRISVSDTASATELLVTVVYRAEGMRS